MFSAVTNRHASLSEPYAAPRQVGIARWAESHSDQVSWGTSSHVYTSADARQRAATKVQEILSGAHSAFTASDLLGTRHAQGSRRGAPSLPGSSSDSSDSASPGTNSHGNSTTETFADIHSVDEQVFLRRGAPLAAGVGAGLLLGADPADEQLGPLAAHQARLLRIQARKQQLMLDLSSAPPGAGSSRAQEAAVAAVGASTVHGRGGAASQFGAPASGVAQTQILQHPTGSTSAYALSSAYGNIWAAGPPPLEDTPPSVQLANSPASQRPPESNSPTRTVSFSEHSIYLSGRSPGLTPGAMSDERQPSEYTERANADMVKLDTAAGAALRARAEDVQRLAFITVHEISRTLRARSKASAAQTALLQEVRGAPPPAQSKYESPAAPHCALFLRSFFSQPHQPNRHCCARATWRAPCTGRHCCVGMRA